MLNYVAQLTSLFTKSVVLPARNVQFHLCHWKRISKWPGTVGWNRIVICKRPGNSHFDCFDWIKSQSIRLKLYLHNKCFTLEVTCHIPIYHVNGSTRHGTDQNWSCLKKENINKYGLLPQPPPPPPPLTLCLTEALMRVPGGTNSRPPYASSFAVLRQSTHFVRKLGVFAMKTPGI